MKNPAGRAERIRKAIEKKRERRARKKGKANVRAEQEARERREYADRMGRFEHAINKE